MWFRVTSTIEMSPSSELAPGTLNAAVPCAHDHCQYFVAQGGANWPSCRASGSAMAQGVGLGTASAMRADRSRSITRRASTSMRSTVTWRCSLISGQPGLQFPRSWLRGKFGVFPGRIVTELASLVVTNDPVVEIAVRNNVNGRNHRQTPHYVPRCCNTEEGAVIKINFVPVRKNCSKLT